MIKTELEYKAAVKQWENLMDARMGTPEAKEYQALGAEISAYESRTGNIPFPEQDRPSIFDRWISKK